MKAKPFKYHRPRSLAEAYDFLASREYETRVLAGGQSLVPMMNLRLAAPEAIVDIGGLGELRGIALAGDAIRIGAMTSHCDVERSPLIGEHAPLIAKAIVHVAHLAVRNRGTFGGSVALADPAAEMPACTLALDGVIVTGSGNGSRRIPANDFFQGLYLTGLRADELLLAVEIPARRPGECFAFQEFSRRHGDFAVTGIAVKAKRNGAALSGVKIVAFGISDRPVLLPAAAALAGNLADRPTLDALKSAIGRDTIPHGDVHYSSEMRLHLAAVLTARCLEDISLQSGEE